MPNEEDNSRADAAVPVKFLKNGDLTQLIEDKPVVVAHYDRKTRHLEFVNEDFQRKLMRQVTAAIGTINKGTQSSGLIIETIGLKGVERDKPAGKVPPRPRKGPLGDQTPEVVEWYFKYYPKEAYARYGVFLDENGEPQRRKVKRLFKTIVDDRNGEHGLMEENEEKGRQVGKGKWERGPVAEIKEAEILEDQIIARRATHMTYTPNEVVGGFDTGEDEESGQVRDTDDDGGDA